MLNLIAKKVMIEERYTWTKIGKKSKITVGRGGTSILLGRALAQYMYWPALLESTASQCSNVLIDPASIIVSRN